MAVRPRTWERAFPFTSRHSGLPAEHGQHSSPAPQLVLGRFRRFSRPRAVRYVRRTPMATGRRRSTSRRYWSAEVTRRSKALDLEEGVFRFPDPRRIAASLKRSADTGRRPKGTAYQSAMSMLTLYTSRPGRTRGGRQKRGL